MWDFEFILFTVKTAKLQAISCAWNQYGQANVVQVDLKKIFK